MFGLFDILKDGDPSSLAILEQYVKELFSGSASNEQLQKIHASLDHFARQKESWRECLYFLSRTSNHETAMYALTVLEVCNMSTSSKYSLFHIVGCFCFFH